MFVNNGSSQQMLTDLVVHQLKCQKSFTGFPCCCCLYLLFAHMPCSGSSIFHPPLIFKDFCLLFESKAKWMACQSTMHSTMYGSIGVIAAYNSSSVSKSAVAKCNRASYWLVQKCSYYFITQHALLNSLRSQWEKRGLKPFFPLKFTANGVFIEQSLQSEEQGHSCDY